jgi:hypothetical protein
MEINDTEVAKTDLINNMRWLRKEMTNCMTFRPLNVLIYMTTNTPPLPRGRRFRSLRRMAAPGRIDRELMSPYGLKADIAAP